jgi:hypothetical protein
MRQISKVIVPLTSGIFLAFISLTQNVQAEVNLTQVEQKWLDAADPVLQYANEHGMQVDVVILPEATADDVPLSMGVREGRCKLVFALRGNPEAEATLTNVSSDRHALMIEAMAAHEIAHCWRYTQGAWHKLPAGFVEAFDGKELQSRRNEMRATQREEGYADLVALAWTRQQHPESYGAVHDWLERVRREQPLPGSFHDTRAWLMLAKQQSAFADNSSPFEQVYELWMLGLRQEE